MALVAVPAASAARLCRIALEGAGTPTRAAARVASALVANERRELPSHGLLRLQDYLQAAAAGTLRVAAEPSVRVLSPVVRVVDGERGFGVLAADAVAEQACEMLGEHEMAAIALVNSNHIGALRDVGEVVAARGSILLGFVNYLGAGQRVIPPSGRRGRLCTNPLLVAVPSADGPAFVLDMSTSAVAEGKIRASMLAGRPVPSGWLVDEEWREVTDPARLYADPPSAFMTPFGGSQVHKGFGLALAVELLAGVLTGAGFVGDPQPAGNGGLFIGMRPTLVGRSPHDLAADVAALRRHTTGPGDDAGVRWPGERRPPAGDVLHVEPEVWRSVQRAAQTASTGKQP